MGEIMNEMNAQMASLPSLVQHWMNWMGLIFLVSIFFVWKRKPARYVLLSMPLTMAIAMVIFYLSRNVHLLGITHLIIWAPLFYYLFRYEIKRENFNFKSIYGVWIGLLMTTIAISLIFDIRDLILIAMGLK